MTPEERTSLDETLKKSAEHGAAQNKKARLAEEQVREQMFKTMVALEKAANAVAKHLNPLEGVTKVSGDLEVEGNLTVNGTTATGSSEVTPDVLAEISKVVAKHHQALALLASFGMMKDTPMLSGTEPAGKIASLLGMAACRNCVGTGWVARDETCSECDRTGYIKA